MIPIVLSAVAVLLSGATFWWNTQRRGHLHIYEAPTYDLTVNEGQVVFCLPLSFTNTGARPWPVRNVRVLAPSLSHQALSWIATYDSLPGEKEVPRGRRYATGFVVPARSTLLQILEFQSGAPVFPWRPEHFEAIVLLQPNKGDKRYVCGTTLTIGVDTTHDYTTSTVHETAAEPDPEAATRKLWWRSGLARLR